MTRNLNHGSLNTAAQSDPVANPFWCSGVERTRLSKDDPVKAAAQVVGHAVLRWWVERADAVERAEASLRELIKSGEETMPEESELNSTLESMCDELGQSDAVRAELLRQPLALKAQMVRGFKRSMAQIEEPDSDALEMVETLSTGPSNEDLDELAAMIRVKPLQWLDSFLDRGGLSLLTDVVEIAESKPHKSSMEIQVNMKKRVELQLTALAA